MRPLGVLFDASKDFSKVAHPHLADAIAESAALDEDKPCKKKHDDMSTGSVENLIGKYMRNNTRKRRSRRSR